MKKLIQFLFLVALIANLTTFALAQTKTIRKNSMKVKPVAKDILFVFPEAGSEYQITFPSKPTTKTLYTDVGSTVQANLSINTILPSR